MENLLKPTSQWEPIPRTFSEAVNALILLLTPEDKKELMEISLEEVGWKTHFGLGMYLRNNWNLWDSNSSALMHQFLFKQPDDVSYAIIEATWEKLTLLSILIREIKDLSFKKKED